MVLGVSASTHGRELAFVHRLRISGAKLAQLVHLQTRSHIAQGMQVAKALSGGGEASPHTDI
jgi:hypothetical protein